MEKENNIERLYNISRIPTLPTIVNGIIEEGCLFENSGFGGMGTLIIDKDFIDDILNSVNYNMLSKKLFEDLTYINQKVNDYFYSDNDAHKSREKVYEDNSVKNDNGGIIGTKLSSLKGKNVALCSEKSIAAYIILEDLYEKGYFSRKPSMVLSTLKTESMSGSNPHAFILIDNEQDNYPPTRHLLFDVQNPTLIEDENGNQTSYIGLYTLDDKQHNNILKGIECTPLSIYETEIFNGYTEIGDKRKYGNKKLNKVL